MGRPRGRPRPRARAVLRDDDDDAAEKGEEPLLFPVGTAVEVRSDDEGFIGSFYEATVEGYLPSGRGYVVAYTTLTRLENGGSPHREQVTAADVRPRPPSGSRHQWREFALHEMVEAFHNEGWWAGVVCRTPSPAVEADGDRPQHLYSVCFPTTREVLEFDEARLRTRLVFLGERWVPAAEAENRNPIFREGSQVEISRSPKTFGQYWSPATVLKVIGAASFLVQYGYVKEDCVLVTEIMDAQYIRPVRNIIRMDSKYRFSPSSFVEVFHEGNWWPGVILDILDGNFMKKYVVKVNSHETDMEVVEWSDVLIVEHTRLRPQYEWCGRKWVRRVKKKENNRGRGPPSTAVKREISSAIQSSNDIDNTLDNIAVLASYIDSDEMKYESGSSIKEKNNNAGAVFEEVCPDLSMCNKNVQINQKLSSYPEETEKQQNSVLAVTSPLSFSSQLSVSGFGHLKYDPKLSPSNQLQLSCPQMISVPSVPQAAQLQASLFGAFGQLRPLPQGPVLGIKSFNLDFTSIEGSKKAFTVKGKKATDKDFYLMADVQKKINARSFVGTALYRKRKDCISSETPEGLGSNCDIGLTKKRRVCKNAEETSQDIYFSEEQTKLRNDYDEDLPNAATYGSIILSGIDPVATVDSTPLKSNIGSQERNVFLRESRVVDDIIPSGIPIGTDELHQGGEVLRLGATKVTILSEHAVNSIIMLDKPCEANVFPSNSLSYQHSNKAIEAENSELRSEQEAVEEFCQQVLFVDDDASIDLLSSTEKVTRNDHQLHKDSIADMVDLNKSCVVPSDNVPTMVVSMSGHLVPNLLPSKSENCEAYEKVDTVVAEYHGNRTGLPNIIPETQHVSTDGPFSAASLPALKGDTSIKQGLTKKSVADEQGVLHPDSSSPMVESAAECSQSTDKSELSQLSSADRGKSTDLEHGNGLIEIKDGEGTPMSKYVPSRTRGSYRPLLQRSLDVDRSILADRPSECLAVGHLPFVKTSPMWAHIEAMEIFSKMPQRLNFHQFENHVPELREGMALGLMLSFANLGESIKQLNVQDDESLFEEKMKGVSSLEADGFDVTYLRSHLETLLYIKNGRAELQDAIKKLDEKIAHEETVRRQRGVQISMLNSTIRQLDLHAYLLRGIMQSVVSQDINHAVEISKLKAEATELTHLYLSAEERVAKAVTAPW